MTIHDTPQEITSTTERDERSGKRLAVTSRAIIGAAGSEIFPLCCPVREEEWIDGWTRDTYDLVGTAPCSARPMMRSSRVGHSSGAG